MGERGNLVSVEADEVVQIVCLATGMQLYMNQLKNPCDTQTDVFRKCSSIVTERSRNCCILERQIHEIYA